MDNNKNGVVEQQEDKSKPMNEDAKVDQMETDKSGPPLSSKNSFEVPFSRAFPESRGPKLQKNWPTVKSALESYGISCILNLVECSMTASLSSKARGNPLYMNLRARMLLLLLAIGVPAYMALRTLRPCPVILMIGHGSTGLCSKFRIEKEQYQKRRKPSRSR
ncbi:KRR1 small subunit processome component homolog [Prunus avium]|uniref:KRR-R motif-containing protein 1 n=1 Tax=Prunus avium TaxID=42229 RepID=A0A6P5RW26_PRUAV|nr:KRR1 small subunit processome component homolog [Prunus avium]